MAYTVCLAYSEGMVEDGLPRTVAVAWGIAEFPQRGPKRELSYEGIVDAAIEIADTEGLEAVTMQRVAAAFGFTTMALYRYISSKDELHRLMLDAAIRGEDLEAIPVDDWRVGLRAWAELLAGRYRQHPWVLQLPADADVLIMPNNMAFVDAGLRAMRTLAQPLEVRLGIIVSCTVMVRGFAGIRADLDQDGQMYSAPTIAAIREVATTARFPDLAPLVASGMYLWADDAPVSAEVDVLGPDFEFALSTFLDGVANLTPGAVTEQPHDAAPSSPREAFEAAERAWREAIAQRKATEQRVKELYKQEAEAQRAKDDAKELMKAAERFERRSARGGDDG